MTEDLVLSCKYVSQHSPLFPFCHLLFFSFHFSISQYTLLPFVCVFSPLVHPCLCLFTPLYLFALSSTSSSFPHPISLWPTPPPFCLPAAHLSSHSRPERTAHKHTKDVTRGPSVRMGVRGVLFVCPSTSARAMNLSQFEWSDFSRRGSMNTKNGEPHCPQKSMGVDVCALLVWAGLHKQVHL